MHDLVNSFQGPVYYAGIISGIIGSEKHNGICWNNQTIPRNNWCNVISFKCRAVQKLCGYNSKTLQA